MTPDERALALRLAEISTAIEANIEPNGVRFAYDRCRVCGSTWFGPRLGREHPDTEIHRSDCWLPVARRALTVVGEAALRAYAALPTNEKQLAEVEYDGTVCFHAGMPMAERKRLLDLLEAAKVGMEIYSDGLVLKVIAREGDWIVFPKGQRPQVMTQAEFDALPTRVVCAEAATPTATLPEPNDA